MSLAERVAKLPFWSQEVEPKPLTGGITNTNFVVAQGDEKFVVRMGHDIPMHGVMRFNELAACHAGFACGISPEVVYTEPGFMIMRFVEGKTLKQEDVIQQSYLERILPVIKVCHNEMPKKLRGPILSFWVFHVIRDYAAKLTEDNSRMIPRLPELLQVSEGLESIVGPISMVFGHNDLLSANFIDDGDKIWMIDWDYSGFTSPLFDLSNLASNNELTTEQERWLLKAYFGKESDDHLWKRYHAMKTASLLREAMWSMVSEIHSVIDFDYVAYTEENMARYERALEAFRKL